MPPGHKKWTEAPLCPPGVSSEIRSAVTSWAKEASVAAVYSGHVPTFLDAGFLPTNCQNAFQGLYCTQEVSTRDHLWLNNCLLPFVISLFFRHDSFHSLKSWPLLLFFRCKIFLPFHRAKMNNSRYTNSHRSHCLFSLSINGNCSQY